MARKVLASLVAVSAAVGFVFSAVSTSDFVAHLDRQVHGIHCSFLPGVGAPDVTGSSGCHVTLMSPYSSILRDQVWGGVPISLPAMAVFAYLAALALALVVTGRLGERLAAGYLLAAQTLPVLTSAVMGWISLQELGAVCKLCIGIYSASGLGFVFALLLFLRADKASAASSATPAVPAKRRPAPVAARSDSTLRDEDLGAAATVGADAGGPSGLELEFDPSTRPDAAVLGREAAAPGASTAPAALGFGAPAALGFPALGIAFAAGLVFVGAPVAAYAANAPDFDRFVGACGTLAHPEDAGHVLVALGPQTQPTQVLEVLDPLCPACRGFEERFAGLEASSQVSRRALLFPLDSECNWMVDRPIHAGACAVSEAVLCAEDDAQDVIAWAFAEQEAIRTATEQDPGAAARMVRQQFPALAECVGSPSVRARLNRALRWAVSNQLPVLTPQVYVNDTRICDADTDLGLDWTLARLLGRRGAEGGAR